MDKLDQLLDRFYRSQIPDPFPPAPMPGVRSARSIPNAPAPTADRSHWALAAGFALVVGTLWALTPSDPKPPRAAIGLGGSSAKLPSDLSPVPDVK